MSGIQTMCVAYGTIPLGQVLRGPLRIEDEERFYWSLDENSRECMSTFKHRCRKCYLKGFYYTGRSSLVFDDGYWQDYNATYNFSNQMPILRNGSDSRPTPSTVTGLVHICWETQAESRRHRSSPFSKTQGFICRNLFELRYWKPLMDFQMQLTLPTSSAGAGIDSESSILPRGFLPTDLKKDQIIIGAVVTVRLSSGNAGFPLNPAFDPNDRIDRHNRLFCFMLIEFYNQKSFSNMALQGIINFLIYMYIS